MAQFTISVSVGLGQWNQLVRDPQGENDREGNYEQKEVIKITLSETAVHACKLPCWEREGTEVER